MLTTPITELKSDIIRKDKSTNLVFENKSGGAANPRQSHCLYDKQHVILRRSRRIPRRPPDPSSWGKAEGSFTAFRMTATRHPEAKPKDFAAG